MPASPCVLDHWLELLACPACGGGLRDESGTTLHCGACGKTLPVHDGIVRSLDLKTGDMTDRIKRQEIKARDDAAPDYGSDSPAWHDRLEVPASLRAMRPAAADDVAELGCGVGRVALRYLACVRRLVAVDFSLRSLLVFRERIPASLRDRILLVQADITALPLARGAFSKVVSFQVIEHLPSAEQRQRAVTGAGELLRPGGAFTLSVYHWSASKRRDAAHGVGDYGLKEGYHESGIYYYNFDEKEVLRMLNVAGLRAERMRGLFIPVRGASLLGPLVLPLNRWLATTRFGRRRAHLLLLRAHKTANVDSEPADRKG